MNHVIPFDSDQIYCRGSSHGRHYDDDIIFERETGNRRRLEGVHHGRGARDHDLSEGDHQRSRELALYDNRENGRRFTKQEDKRERLWTEITRNLVSAEAIKEKGYEFEESDEFYYVMEYLKYVGLPPLLSYKLHLKCRRYRQRYCADNEYSRRRTYKHSLTSQRKSRRIVSVVFARSKRNGNLDMDMDMDMDRDAPSQKVHGMRSGLSKGRSSTMVVVVEGPDATDRMSGVVEVLIGEDRRHKCQGVVRSSK